MYFFYITKAIEKTIGKNILKECGITHSDGKLIVMIGLCPSVHQVDLADLLDISPPAVSRKIDRLVKKGYVTRQTNKDNRRSQNIGLTKQGNALFTKTYSYLKETLDDLLQDMGGIGKTTEKELERITTHLKGGMSDTDLCLQESLEKKYK